MSTICSPEIDGQELMLVEDEKTPREELSRYLLKKGFKVRAISGGGEAISSAEIAGVGVILMDIEMAEGDLDGIEAARTIQSIHPFSSVIFVTAHYGNPDYQRRVEECGLRVGGWIGKPITTLPRLEELAALIEKEMKKVQIRVSIAKAAAQGIAPADHLHSLSLWDPSLPQDIVQELIVELEGENMAVDAEITRLYSEIRSLIAGSAVDPSLKINIDPLMEHLRRLQEQEADEMERRFRARLSVQPDAVRELLTRAERMARA
jgi:CheY-like chemotaxis protein